MNNYRIEILHFSDNSVTISHAAGRVRGVAERTRDARAEYRAHLNSPFYEKARKGMLEAVTPTAEGLSKNEARRDTKALIRYFTGIGRTVNNCK